MDTSTCSPDLERGYLDNIWFPEITTMVKLMLRISLLFHIVFKSACQFLQNYIGIVIENAVNLYTKLKRITILIDSLFLSENMIYLSIIYLYFPQQYLVVFSV